MKTRRYVTGLRIRRIDAIQSVAACATQHTACAAMSQPSVAGGTTTERPRQRCWVRAAALDVTDNSLTMGLIH